MEKGLAIRGLEKRKEKKGRQKQKEEESIEQTKEERREGEGFQLGLSFFFHFCKKKNDLVKAFMSFVSFSCMLVHDF